MPKSPNIFSVALWKASGLTDKPNGDLRNSHVLKGVMYVHKSL